MNETTDAATPDANRVLVTGASRGIGKAVCTRLLADGYRVVGVARHPPQDMPSGMAFCAVDLADRDALTQFLRGPAFAEPFYGLVNNVALPTSARLLEVQSSDLYQSVQLNIEVAIVCTQALAPAMRAAGAGRIVNIASRAALGKEGRTIYGMTKAGMIGMTRTWALELAPFGITVNAIAPGPIATELFWQINPADDARTQALLAGIPVGRMGLPEDVAHAAAYFMDARSGFVTGQTHFVCGGTSVGSAGGG